MSKSKALRIMLLGGVLFFGTSCADDSLDELDPDESVGGGYYDENDNVKKKADETAPLSE